MEEMSSFARNVYEAKYKKEGDEDWDGTARRVADAVMGPVFPDLVEDAYELIRDRVFMPGGRYLYAAGRNRQAVNNCFLLRAEDSREGWGDLMRKVTNALMFGGGVGVDYSAIREDGAYVNGLGGTATGPISLMHVVNEIGRSVMAGGSRRSALWGGINWKHPDALKLTEVKDWPEYLVKEKEKDFSAAAPLDMTNISILLDDEFFEAYYNKFHEKHHLAHEVYNRAVESMLRSGEPGFSVDVGKNAGETLRNACTEVTSADDSDVCNLGSIVLPRVRSIDHMRQATCVAIAFLLAGSIMGDVPLEETEKVRAKNRRLGLGIMGFAEWYAERGIPYGEKDQKLEAMLRAYKVTSERSASFFAHRAGVSTPIKTRAIAPTGSISILAETTSGIEPFFCASYKRRWLKNKQWQEEVVVDAAVQRLIDRGVPPEWIEDAYDLADDPERRLAFQVWVQEYVDHAISSTLNLPNPEEQLFDEEKFGAILITYLRRLRGVTVYPDGCRGGQPLTRVPLEDVVREDHTQEETGNERSCVNGVCGV